MNVPECKLRLVVGLVGALALAACADAPTSGSSGSPAARTFQPQAELLQGTRYCLNALSRNLRRAPAFRQEGYFRRPNGGYVKQGQAPLFRGTLPPKAIVQYIPKSRSVPVHSCIVALEGATRPSQVKGVSKAEGKIFDFVVLGALAEGFVLQRTEDAEGNKVFLLKNQAGQSVQLVSRVIVEGKVRTMYQTLVRLP